MPRSAIFRVCTVDDFTGSQNQEQGKRKSAHSTTACQPCHSRKIKCFQGAEHNQRSTGSNFTPHLRCQPCREAGLECHWDAEAQWKRPRMGQASAVTKNAKQREPQLEFEQARNVGQLINPPAGQEQAPEQGSVLDSWESADIALAENPDTANVLENIMSETRGLSPRTLDLLTNADNEHVSQLFLANLPQGEPSMPSPNFFDFGDIMLDWNSNPEIGGSPYFTLARNATQRFARSSSPTSSPGAVRIRYYRILGPTAALPGLRRVALVLDKADEEQSAPEDDSPEAAGSVRSAHTGRLSATKSMTSSILFDETNQQPHPAILPRILDIFFERFGGHYPFLDRQTLDTHVSSHVASSFLLNAMAALAMRFCPLEGHLAPLRDVFDAPWRYGKPFLEKAKEQLIPLLSIPEPEVVGGLVLLSWAEFGDNNEAGLWMFAGMAIRMVQDLGFHRTTETDVDVNASLHDRAWPQADGTYSLTDEQQFLQQQKARLVMFWSVFILDVCVSLVTGRPPTFRRSEILVAIPSFQDMKLAQLDFDETVTARNMFFPTAVQFMVQFAEAVELLNQTVVDGPAGSGLTDMPPSLDRKQLLMHTRESLVLRYESLSKELAFNMENLKISAESAQSGVFLIMHLFFFTITALLSNAPLREARNDLQNKPASRPLSKQTVHNAQREGAERYYPDADSHTDVVTVACQKIVQIGTIANLVDTTSYLAAPFTNHCFHVAASIILEATLGQTASPEETSVRKLGSRFFMLTARADYEILHRVLTQQTLYFSGIESVVALLERKEKGLKSSVHDSGTPNVHESSEDEVRRVGALDDAGLVNRYSIRSTVTPDG